MNFDQRLGQECSCDPEVCTREVKLIILEKMPCQKDDMEMENERV